MRITSMSISTTAAAAAVAASTAIEALTGIHTSVKWVNDLYRNGAKVGGILTEAVTLQNGSHRMVVGLGINLSTAEFPAGLRAPAASLFPSDSTAVPPPPHGQFGRGDHPPSAGAGKPHGGERSPRRHVGLRLPGDLPPPPALRG